jgi:anti-sigma factor RsiW
MSCQFIQESISSYLDNRLEEQERETVDRHLAVCGECAAFHRQTLQLRVNLRSMAPVRPPKKLGFELRVLASREVLRRSQTTSQFWRAKFRLMIDNLMRPLALPFAGGLASAVLIFGALVPTLGFLRSADNNDQPSALYTEASVDNVADFGAQSKASGDTLIEVQVDGQGRMVDYNVPVGQMTGEIGNMLLFTRFTPATKFLKPASGKLVIRVSRIVVKG